MNNFNFDLDSAIDEDFFGSLKDNSSKLQQLFGEDSITQDEKQQSLKYQRPKATDLKDASKDITATATETATTSSNQSTSSSVTLMAKVVVAYKLGELQGKVGLALIQNSDNTHGLIIYKTKTNILATMKFAAGQDLLFKQTNYWQFFDEETVYWSFCFEAPKDEQEFKEKLKSKDLTFKETNEENFPGDYKENEIFKQIQESYAQNLKELKDVEDIQSTINSIKEETKDSLIQRMAKMGTPLPNLTAPKRQISSDYSDCSDTEVISTASLAIAQKPSIAPRSSSTKLVAIRPNKQVVTTAVTYKTAAPTTSDNYPLSPVESQYMHMLLSEQRTQGSELRMNITKLENKMEKMLDKMEVLDKKEPKEKRNIRDDEILELEEKILMLKKENRKLKQASEDIQDNKIKEILEYFDSDFEQLNIDYDNDLKTILKSLTEKMMELQIDNKELQQKFDRTDKKLKDLQKKFNTEKSTVVGNEKELKLLKEKEELLKMKLQEKDKIIKDTEQQLVELRTELDSKQLTTIDSGTQLHLLREKEQILKINLQEKVKIIKDYEQQIIDLNQKVNEKIKKKSISPTEAFVKNIMNNLYLDIQNKLYNFNYQNSDHILSLIAASIKQQTLNSLQ